VKHFGFFSSSRRAPKHNASLHLAELPAWYYFQRPTNLTSHNLCTVHQPPPNFRSLLGLGLNFCPRPLFSNKEILSSTIARFRRDLYNRFAYAGEESHYDSMLYARSNRAAPEHLVASELKNRINNFSSALHRLFRKKQSASNLLPHQRACLRSLRTNPELIVCKTDKNLGPAIMDRKRYIALAFRDHLSDKATYRQLTKEEACQKMQAAEREIKSWLATHKHRISPAGLTFLKRTLNLKDPDGNTMFPQFYILAKLHKTPLATRPIVSVSGTLLHGFGRWVNRQLQQPGQSIPSFINSSYALTQRLCTLQEVTPLPPTTLV